MDELEGNLRILLNGIPETEECVSISMGIREALVVIAKARNIAPPAPASPVSPQFPDQRYPPHQPHQPSTYERTPPAQHGAWQAYEAPRQASRPERTTAAQDGEAGALSALEGLVHEVTPQPDTRYMPTPSRTAPEVMEDRPQTVQFIPRRAVQPSAGQTAVPTAPRPPAPPPPPRQPGQHPELLFRSCSSCGNQLIVPHIPISVMCPHCKSTVTIAE